MFQSVLRRPVLALGLALAIAGLPAAAALAHGYKAGQILIGHPWMPPASGSTAAVGLSLLNQGTDPDRLIGATTDAARAVVLVDLVGGKPTPVSAIELLPGKPIPLKPGARELRLEGMAAPLAPGATIMLTLTFEKAGSLPVEVMVEATPGP